MKQISYVWNLTRFAFRHNPWLYLGLVISLLSAGIELLAMSSLIPLFELVSGKNSNPPGLIERNLASMGFPVNASALLWVFIVLFTARIVTQLVGQSLAAFLGKRVMAQLCWGAFSQIIRNLSIREVNEKSIGFYISLAGDESFRASNLIIALTQLVSTAALAVFYFLAIALYSPTSAAVVAAFLVCSMLMVLRIMKTSHRIGILQTEGSRRAISLFLDSLNNIKAVRAFSAESYVTGLHRKLIFSYSRVLFWGDEIALLTRLAPVLLLLVFFGSWFAFSEAKFESIGIAFIVTMIVYLMRFFPVVGQVATMLMRIATDAQSGRDVTAVLDATAHTTSNATKDPGDVRTVTFQDVCFQYESGKPVLKDVSFRMESGKSYALVGKSGQGKSTLVDILLKFYEPASGRILINDTPLAEVADEYIRGRVLLVSQEAAIFDDTVANNVRMGSNAGLGDVQAACELAGIHDIIDSMPEQYETRLQYKGSNLSGGQRQRIAIARALLRNPDVLVLDESTSALDKSTQSLVVDNIRRKYSDKIIVFITHDPQLINKLDRVIDLETVNRLMHHASTGSPSPIQPQNEPLT